MLAILGVLVASAVAVWRTAHKDEARRESRVQVIAVLGAAQYNGRPSATFELLPGAGHMLHHFHADAVVRAALSLRPAA